MHELRTGFCKYTCDDGCCVYETEEYITLDHVEVLSLDEWTEIDDVISAIVRCLRVIYPSKEIEPRYAGETYVKTVEEYESLEWVKRTKADSCDATDVDKIEVISGGVMITEESKRMFFVFVNYKLLYAFDVYPYDIGNKELTVEVYAEIIATVLEKMDIKLKKVGF